MPAYDFKRIETPYRQEGKETSVFIVEINHVPREWLEWLEVNARRPNEHSAPFKGMIKTLAEQPESFLMRNLGMTIMAESCSSKDGLVKLVFSNPELHGVLDGGHTLKALLKAREEDPEGCRQRPAYVKIECLTGFRQHSESVDIADARNTSSQVAYHSLEDLRGSFDVLRDALSGTPYADRIAYTESDGDEDGAEIARS